MSSAAVATATAERPVEMVEVNKFILDDLIKATTENERQKFVIIPRNFEEAEKYAEFVSKSQLLPKGMGKSEVFLVIQVGLELGLSPMQALKGMFCVNNRVSIYGDLAVALVLRSGQCEAFDEDNAQVALKQGFGRCRVKRKGSVPCRVDPAKPEIKCIDAHAQRSRQCCLEHRFSIEEAKAAKLWAKDGPWTSYPGRMLQMRPRSWAIRDLFADVLLGMGIFEEDRDIPVQAPLTTAVMEETLKKPARKSEAAAQPTEPAKEPLVVEDKDPAPAQTAPAPIDATEGSGEYIITKVEVIGYKDKKSGADRKFFKLTADSGGPFATFSDTDADMASSCIGNKTPVAIAWKRTPGKENLAIKSLSPVMGDSAIPDEPGSNG